MNLNPMFASQSGQFDAGALPNSTTGDSLGNSLGSNWTPLLASSTGMSIGASRSLLFIDSRIEDQASLLAGIAANTEVFVLSPVDNAIAQITNILLEREGIDSIQIVSHGTQGGLLLGDDWIDADYLAAHQDELARWSDALMADADILLYGCNVAKGAVGEEFIQKFAALTGADVAGSDDLTGSDRRGGDWTLEVNTGEIAAQIAFNADVLRAYDNIFVTYTGTSNLAATTLNENVTIVGDAILNVAGDFTLNSGFRIAGDGVSVSDSLTIKSTGKVTLGSNVGTLGFKNLKIEAAEIDILAGVNITIDGDLNFSVSDQLSTLTSLIPVAGSISGDIKEATIKFGVNTRINATNISLNAAAEDVNPVEGINQYLAGALVTPLIQFGTDVAALPVSMMLRQSKARIDIGDNAIFNSTGDIDIATSAVADASAKAISKFFSVGWSDATASAITQIGQGVQITAADSVNITADASATSSMTTRTLKNLGSAPANGNAIAVSLAIANADLTANTTIAQGAVINAGRNANITANGTVEREASAEAGVYQDGRAGISAGLGFTKSDVQAVVNGSITSGTALQKLFDPSSAVNVAADHITIANHGFTKGQAVVYRKPDNQSALGGLEDGNTYFVILIDANTIQLAESASDVEENQAIDLKATGLQGTHTLSDPGIRVVAKLESEDKSDATSGVGGEPAIADTAVKPEIALTSLFDKLMANNASAKSGSGGSGSKANFSAAGALAFNKINNNVAATIGITGQLKSNADIYVQAMVENKLKNAAESSTEAADNSSNQQQNSVSAAVIVGLYENRAKATIADGAKTDAKRDTQVNAEVVYPFLSAFKDNFDFDQKLKDDGLKGFADYLDGTLGFKSTLFNSWAKSVAKGENLGIAGTLNFQSFTNDTQAIIGNNAEVNQDVAYQTDDQSVTVSAKTDVNLINVTGVFDFEISLDKLNDLRTSKDALGELNPAGSQAEKGGVGGSLFLMFNDSTTIAKVEAGAKVRTGADGGLTIAAESKNLDVNVAQSGANGGQFSVGGTFSYTDQETVTLAQLESGTTVTGGRLDLTANDQTTRVNAVGGVSKGGNVGVGLSVGINQMDRDVAAILGNRSGAAGLGTTLNVADTNIAAEGKGGLWVFSLAAGVAAKKPGSQEAQNPPAQPEKVGDSTANADDPLDGVTLPTLFGEMQPESEQNTNTSANTSNDKGNQGKAGIGISGDVSINRATDRITAAINDAGTINAGALTVDAKNRTEMRVASGSVAIASADQGKTSVGLAGSFSMNTLAGDTLAYVHGRASNGQDLNLTATSLTVNAARSGNLFALSASGSGALGQDGYAVAGSVSINRITNRTEAYLSGGRLTIANQVAVNAKDESKIFAINGAIGVGGKAGIGAAVALNQINNTVKANSSSVVLNHGTGLTLAALNNGEITAIAASAGAGKSVGIAGTVSVNRISLTTEAASVATSRTNGLPLPTGLINLTAKNQATIKSLAGAVGVSQSVGLGAAVGYNGITNNTDAYIRGGNLATSGNVEVTAESTASIQSLVMGVGGGKTVGLGGSVAINLIRGGNRAFIDSNAQLLAAGQIRLRALDNSTIEGLSGGAAAGGTAAVGAAISVNDLATNTTSYIEQSTVTSQGAGVSALAQGNATIKALTIGAAGGGKVAIGGSVSVNVLRNTVDSHIGNNANVTAAQDIDLQALETSTIEAKGGGFAGAGKVAVAGAVVVNDLASNVTAKISGSTANSTQGNVSLKANSADMVETIAVGGAGGTVGVAGSTAISMMDNTIIAEIANSTVTADDSVLAIANSSNTINFYGGTVAGGAGGVGGSASVNTVSNQTKAAVTGNSNVNAKGNAATNVTKADDTGATEAVRGLAVLATSNEDVNIWTANIAGGGIGVAATASVTVLDDETLAYIDGSSINANSAGANLDQTVNVRAFNNSDITVRAGAISVGGTAVGATVDVTVIGNTTRAYMNNSPIVNAQRGVNVTAFSRETVDSIVVSGSGGGVGVAGSVLVSDLRSTTEAYLNSANVNTFGTLRVLANDQVNATAKAGAAGLGLGGVGIGATIGVLTINNSTTARITNSITNARDLTEVRANTNEAINTLGGSAGIGGWAGAAGSVLVSSLTSKTLAYVDGTSQVNQDAAYQSTSQDVTVNAQNRSTINGGVVSIAGSLSGGGFGASVMVAGMWNTTSAYIGDGVRLKAGRNLTINAVSEKEVTPTVMAFAGGWLGAVAGAVSVVTIGGGISSDGTSAVSNTNSKTNEQTNRSHLGSNLGSTSYANRAKTQADSKTLGMNVDGNFSSSAPIVNGTTAFIGNGANISTGGNLAVNADERITVNQTVGRAQGGFVSVGGSVAVANVQGNAQAFVGNNAVLNAGGAVNVTANYNGNQTSSSKAGSGGIVSLGAQVVILNDNSTQRAYLGNGAQITQANGVQVQANATRNISSTTADVSIGGVVAGASISRVKVNGTTEAFVGTNAQIGQLAGSTVGSLNVSANSTTNATTRSSSVSAALAAAIGSDAEAQITNTVSATIGGGAQVTTQGNIQVVSSANNRVDVDSSAVGIGFVAAGAVKTTARINNQNTASTGNGAILNSGQSVTILAQSTNNVANSRAQGGSGGLVAGASTEATAEITDNTKARVGDSSQINAINGTIRVEATVSNEAHSVSNITTGGAITSNLTEARSNVTSQTQTEIGSNAVLNADQIQVYAKGTKLDVDADAFSKTVAANSTSNARSFLNLNVDTKITNFTGAQLNSDNRIDIISRMDNVDTDSNAKGTIEAGLTGSIYATAHNEFDLDAEIDVQSQSKIAGTDIFIEAYSPDNKDSIYSLTPEATAKTVVKFITETIKTVSKAVSWIPFIGSLVEEIVKWVTRTIEQVLNSDTQANRSGNFNSNNRVNLGGDIYQGAPATARLTVTPDLSIFTEGNISAQIVGNEVVVNDVIARPTGTLVINSYNGDVTGNVTIHKNSVLSLVEMINNSTKDLRINRIQTINKSATSPDLQINTNNRSITTNFVSDVVGDPVINIRNNVASNVIFAGAITNVTGVMNVQQTGNIISTGATIENKAVTLNATGNVGSAANRLKLRLFDTNTNATLSSNVGNLFLDAQLVGTDIVMTTAPITIDGLDFSNVNAVGNIDIVVQAAEGKRFNTTTYVLSDEAADATYHLKDLSSSQGSVTIAFNRGTTVNMGRVSASQGTVNLNTVGTLVDANTTGADITAQAAYLQATGNIGAANDAIDSNVRKLEANGANFWLNNTGNLAIGGVTAATGISVTGQVSIANAGGSVTVNENVTAAGAVSMTTTDTNNNGEDIEVADNAKVESTTNAVQMLAGDNLRVNATGQVKAATQISLAGDNGNADAGVGSTIDLRGSLIAPSVQVTGGSDDDIVSLTNVQANAPITIQTQAGDDLIHLGSQATPATNVGGTVNAVAALLNIDAGTG
ncbi:MAG: hypothetical protein RLZZ511_2022, partial [Cyanobacteriota bacterium]